MLGTAKVSLSFFFCPWQFEVFDCSFLHPQCFHNLFLKQPSLKAGESESWLHFLSLNCSVWYITLNEFCQSFLHIHLSMSVCNCSLFVHDWSNLWGCYCPFFFTPNCENSSFISLEVMELLITYINQYYRQWNKVCIVLSLQRTAYEKMKAEVLCRVRTQKYGWSFENSCY